VRQIILSNFDSYALCHNFFVIKQGKKSLNSTQFKPNHCRTFFSLFKGQKGLGDISTFLFSRTKKNWLKKIFVGKCLCACENNLFSKMAGKYFKASPNEYPWVWSYKERHKRNRVLRSSSVYWAVSVRRAMQAIMKETRRYLKKLQITDGGYYCKRC